MNETTYDIADRENTPFEIDPEILESQRIALVSVDNMLARAISLSISHLENPDEGTDDDLFYYNRSQLSACKMVVETVLKRVNKMLATPEHDKLWTSDECSAAIVDEWHNQAVQEVTRLSAEIDERQKLHLQQYGTLERSDLVDVMEIELQEAKDWRNRCRESLLSNPKSDYLPF